MEELAKLRRERVNQPVISKCLEEMRQELEKYEYFRPANQRIDESFLIIEEELSNYEKITLKRRNVEDIKKKTKKLDIRDLDLPENIFEIIYGEYEIQPNWCPRFSKVCVMILVFSEMIRDALLKRGSTTDVELNVIKDRVFNPDIQIQNVDKESSTDEDYDSK